MTTTRIEQLTAPEERFAEILTPEALRFVARLHDQFAHRRQERLIARMRRAGEIENGRDFDFLPETEPVRREPSWRVAGPGPGLEDRRVEITGPTDAKMAINALNSGARVWLADHEDALSPTWDGIVGGQRTLRDAIRGELEHTTADGREYRVTAERTPTIVFRPRGWHLVEKHLRYVDRAGIGSPASASLVDFGLYAFHNARELVERGRGPYFYLPKIESHLEARLWDDVFTFTENALGLEHGTIRATVLIETIPAAFEMEEILYELRDHAAGLNAGRWDYIFSIVKHFRGRGRRYLLPDRARITMTVPFMRAYTDLLVATCHRRGAQAIGGMSAFIPNRRRPEVTERALAQVAADKRREAEAGFDGSWVAHPDLVEVATAEFDAVLGDRPNQLDRMRDDVAVTAAQLLDVHIDDPLITDAGVRTNVSVALRYLEAWLRGTGAVAIDDLMEDAATAEISRSQLWQWIRNGVRTEEGTPVTRAHVDAVAAAVLAELPRHADDRYDAALALFREGALGEAFPEFLTVPAYAQHLVEQPVGRLAAAG
ncbi:malate synthase A [Pseudolysinimonas sp.]|uniref:malate synthase A n=1 Tax=Pseudolysinimonas sp. TaxID=2680009 RepID=UPI003F80F67E